MSDLITRARKEWCARSFQMTKFSGEKYVETDEARAPCPEEVVAALLDVLDGMSPPILDDPRLHYVEVQIDGALIEDAKAAITRALEGRGG